MFIKGGIRMFLHKKRFLHQQHDRSQCNRKLYDKNFEKRLQATSRLAKLNNGFRRKMRGKDQGHKGSVTGII